MIKECALAAVASLVLLNGPAQAQSVQDFYKGKTLRLIVGFGPGGAYDAYTRLLARHIGNHVPGSPTVVVQNMPGAGSVVSANYIFNVAPKDGTVLGAFHQRIPVEPKLRPSKRLRFNGQEFTWIGSLSKNISVCVTWHKSGLKSVNELKTREVMAGASSNVDSAAVFARATNAILGTKMKLFTGYGADETNLALLRGEIEARCGWGYASLVATKSEWLTNKQVFIPLVFGSERLKALPDTPTLMELATNPEHKKMLEVLFATQDIARPIAGPPGLPKDRTEALRAAFDKALADPRLLADAKKSSIDIEPVSGANVEKIIGSLYKLPEATYAQVRTFFEPVKGETKKK